MAYLLRLLGSLQMAVTLLVAIAIVLAWGTIYETRFGTAAVQRFMYQSWWFQGLLGFLAVNLAVAALQRYPWKRQHAPFVLAHLGIILILLGGILGGRFGIDGQLIIPEGQAERMLQLPQNVLVVSQPNPGIAQVIPTHFEATAWNHEPHARFPISIEGRSIQLVVDRYFPNAASEEQITGDGTADNPAIELAIRHEEQTDRLWLLAHDPQRFGIRWGEAHLLFLEPATDEQLNQLLGRSQATDQPRGAVVIEFPSLDLRRQVPVPTQLNQPMRIDGTPYTVTFKAYFSDFGLTEQGPANRSDEPNNPAIALTLSGPEGTDAHLLFAFHPDFPALHGRQQQLNAHLTYTHPAGGSLPPNAITIVRQQTGGLAAVMTGAGGEQQTVDAVEPGKPLTHPWLNYQIEVKTYFPKANVTQRFWNRSDEVKAELLHLTVQEGQAVAEGWVALRGSAQLPLNEHPIIVEYRPAQRELPFTVKLLDFRKIDYPGTQMAAEFESDVELIDPKRGFTWMRKVSMNNPLRYRGFHLYQSSYIAGPTARPGSEFEGRAGETTVLSVRNDPGTPFVYAGFIIVIGGVVSMFVLRRSAPAPATRRPRRQGARRP